MRERLWPSHTLWSRIAQGRTFGACVRDGVLGFTVVLSYDAPVFQ